MSVPSTAEIDRFLGSVVVGDGCWTWDGYVATTGYGKYGHAYAHRISYSLFRGDLPSGIAEQVDHLCRNRLCARPSHLELVPQRLNILRGESASARNAVKTHCPQGHSYDDHGFTNNRGQRQCRPCKRARDARRRENAFSWSRAWDAANGKAAQA